MSSSPDSINTWPWKSDRWNKRRFNMRMKASETYWLIAEYLNDKGVLTEERFNDMQARGIISEKAQFNSGKKASQLSAFSIDRADQGFINDRLFPRFFDETRRLKACDLLLARLINVIDILPFHLQEYVEKKLVKEGMYSTDYVFRTLHDQISVDLNIIYRIFQQRRLVHDENVTSEGYMLHLADVLAATAIQPAIAMGVIPSDITVLTYLKNRIDVRLVPYDNVMLLGIPNGITTVHIDWISTEYLAIPHEMGHYVFEYGQDLNTNERLGDKLKRKIKNLFDSPSSREVDIQQQQSQMTLLLERWLEEIFADVYGCFVAGPASILSFQELLASGQPGVHEASDNKHPIPPLRPLIQTMILRQLATKQRQIVKTVEDRTLINKWAANLNTNWENWVRHNWSKQIGITDNDTNNSDLWTHKFHINGLGEIPGEMIRQPIETAVAMILDEMQQMMQQDYSLSWLEPLRACTSLSHLYDLFTKGDFIPQPPERPHTTTQRGAPATHLLQIERYVEDKVLDMDKWVDEILFDAWSTEGPEGGHSGI